MGQWVLTKKRSSLRASFFCRAIRFWSEKQRNAFARYVCVAVLAAGICLVAVATRAPLCYHYIEKSIFGGPFREKCLAKRSESRFVRRPARPLHRRLVRRDILLGVLLFLRGEPSPVRFGVSLRPLSGGRDRGDLILRDRALPLPISSRDQALRRLDPCARARRRGARDRDALHRIFQPSHRGRGLRAHPALFPRRVRRDIFPLSHPPRTQEARRGSRAHRGVSPLRRGDRRHSAV